MKFKGDNTFKGSDEQKSRSLHSNPVIYLSIWVSSLGSSRLAACLRLPGGGFYILYFHPGIVLAEDGLDQGSLGSVLGFQPSCGVFFRHKTFPQEFLNAYFDWEDTLVSLTVVNWLSFSAFGNYETPWTWLGEIRDCLDS